MYHTANLVGISNEALTQGLLMMLVGMVVVFGALILIMLLLLLMRTLPSAPKQATAPAKSAPAPSVGRDVAKPAAVDQDATGVAPEILAVISAAVVAVAGSGAQIRSIRLVRPAGQSPWAEQGRSRHHQSHRVHRGKR